MRDPKVVAKKLEWLKAQLKDAGEKEFLNQMAHDQLMYRETIAGLRKQVQAAQDGAMTKLFKDKPLRSILIYGNRKCDPTVFPATDAGYKALFELLDKSWRVYGDLSAAGVAELNHTIRGCQTVVSKFAKGPIPEQIQVRVTEVKAELERNLQDLARAREQRAWLVAARLGDVQSIKWLLQARKDYEYESYQVLPVEEVL